MDPLNLNSPVNTEKGMKTSLKWEESEGWPVFFWLFDGQ